MTAPKTLAGSLGPGWTATAQDTLGELLLRTWLNTAGLPLADASAAAAGWGGDRLELLTGPGQMSAVAVITRWDTAADAAEFAAAVRRAAAGLSEPLRVEALPGSTAVAVAIAPTPALVEALSGALATALGG